MFSFLTKKKLTEDKVANIFVNSLLDTIEQGFPEVAMLINEDPGFEVSPSIDARDGGRFMMIVLAGNLRLLPDHFVGYQDMRIMDKIYRKLAAALKVDMDVLKKSLTSYQTFCSKVNHPSKNVLYSMSKGVFYKYNLNNYQEEYFKGMNCPNPIFLKRLDEVMANFVLDWTHITDKYKIVE